MQSQPEIFTTIKEINNATFGRPHIVILGAGASRAAFPSGDKYGMKLPVMKDFVDVLGLRELLEEEGICGPYDDFEAIFSDICENPNLGRLKINIEKTVYAYFSSLQLPDSPTIYDHLVLSLRPKDVIATFNWDPFLWNACFRNRKFSTPPCILFLHGCVAMAHCPRCKIVAARNNTCIKCGSALVPSPLLYPVKNKCYSSDPAIGAHWRTLQNALKVAWAITVYGYGAPKTDVDAVKLMKNAWGDVEKRELEETEVIDIRSPDYLRAIWSPFIHTHHYSTAKDFYDSFLARHPRRTCEALWACLMECQFLDEVAFPKDASFDELYAYLRPRLDVENRGSGH